MIKQQAQTFINSAKLVLANEPDDQASVYAMQVCQKLCDDLQIYIDRKEKQKSVDATGEGVK